AMTLSLLAWGFSAAFPHTLNGAAETLQARPYRSMATGIAGVVFVLLAGVLLALTVVLIPVALALLALTAAGAVLGFAVASRATGETISFTRFWSGPNITAAGAIGLLSLGSLPLIGALALFLAATGGMGAILIRYFGGKS
ncbi:MAG: hypothetical protein ACYCSN_21025, partial [Acidobacteriaceae bacterium]